MDYQVQTPLHTVMSETNPVVRAGIQAALFGKGIREVVSCKDGGSLQAALNEGMVDLLLIDSDLPDLDVCDLVQQIRRNNLGRNPFVVIIATVSNASQADIRKVINSGVDRVLCKPLPMSVVLDQVSQLARSRRPFVATDSYVGPTRRANRRPDDDDETLLEAPNTMRCKMGGRATERQLGRLVENGLARVHELRQQSTPLAISRAISRVLAFYDGKGTIDRVRADLDRMLSLGRDMVRIHRGTSLDYLADLAQSLVCLVMLMAPDPARANKVHRHLMSHMRDVMRQAAKNNEDSVRVAQEIAATIGGYAGSNEMRLN